MHGISVTVLKMKAPPKDVKNKASPFYKCKIPDSLPDLVFGGRGLVQADAKKFVPPGLSVWRANKKGYWCFHMKPHKRTHEAWSSYEGDSFNALMAGIRHYWGIFLSDNLLKPSDCPIKGIFSD